MIRPGNVCLQRPSDEVGATRNFRDCARGVVGGVCPAECDGARCCGGKCGDGDEVEATDGDGDDAECGDEGFLVVSQTTCRP